jgi:hypothetical protein
MKLVIKISLNTSRKKKKGQDVEEHYPRGDVYTSVESVYQQEPNELKFGFQRNDVRSS